MRIQALKQLGPKFCGEEERAADHDPVFVCSDPAVAGSLQRHLGKLFDAGGHTGGQVGLQLSGLSVARVAVITRQNDAIRDAAELFEHRPVIFVAAGAKDHAQRAIRSALLQARAQGGDRIDVMCGIEQDFQTVGLWKPFNSTGAADTGQSASLGFQRGRHAGLREQIECCASDGAVVALVLTHQRQLPAGPLLEFGAMANHVEHLAPVRGGGLEAEVEVTADLVQGGRTLRGDGSDGRGRFTLGHAADDRDSRLDDPSLLRGDFAQRLAEDVLMVQADGGDRRDCRRASIGAVQPSAEADFQHHRAAIAPFEMQQRHCRGQVKECRRTASVVVQRIGGLADRGDQFHDFRLCRLRAVDDKPFFQVHQVGRSVQTGADARGGQHGSDHRRRAAFALGAGHMHHRHLATADPPQIQQIQQIVHPPEPERVRFGFRGPLVVNPVVQILDRGQVGSRHRAGCGRRGRSENAVERPPRVAAANCFGTCGAQRQGTSGSIRLKRKLRS